MSDANQATIKAFKEVVNMPAKTLQDWLKTEHSLAVGFKTDEKGESVGHQSGTHILKLLKLKPNEFTTEDIKFANKVVGYVKRHLAQKPQGDITETNWRYSLMNWGHDPNIKK